MRYRPLGATGLEVSEVSFGSYGFDNPALLSAALDAGKQRLRPILMTTTTTVLALLPMALGLGAGDELRTPLAVTVIGGLVGATALTLIVTPCLYRLVAVAPVRVRVDESGGPP